MQNRELWHCWVVVYGAGDKFQLFVVVTLLLCQAQYKRDITRQKGLSPLNKEREGSGHRRMTTNRGEGWRSYGVYDHARMSQATEAARFQISGC